MSQQIEVTVTVTDLNEAPVVIPVPVVELTVGNPATTLDLSEFFTDTDGDLLTYALDAQESPEVASAVVEENSLSITPLEEGKASFVVTASDPSGLEFIRYRRGDSCKSAAAGANGRSQRPHPPLSQRPHPHPHPFIHPPPP